MSKLNTFGVCLLNCIDKINDFMKWVAIISIIAMAAVTNYEVISRYLFNSPTMFSAELSQIMQVFLATLAAGWVLREEGHVTVKLLIDRFGSKGKSYIQLVTSAMSVIFCGLVTWLLFLLFLSSFRARLGTVIMGWPLYLVRLIAVIGLSLLALQFIVRSHKHFRLSRDGANYKEVARHG